MAKQMKNGKCTCWTQVDARLAKEGSSLSRAFNFSGHEFLELKTIRNDGKRKPPARIVCSCCPFCGAQLK